MTQAVLWTARTAARATGGRATADWSATGVSIDSRTLAPGDLFVALKGPNFDAHDFIPDALAGGAAAVVAERLPEDAPPDAPALLVDDTLRALHDLGRAARAATGARVIGITGSVGKTGTKEALRHCLAAQGTTHASVASYNNQWGVPLSLARMPADTRFAIFEMGMNAPGEIATLTALVRPDVAVITAIASAHIGALGSLEAIADAKSEIFLGVTAGGTAVLPRESGFFERLEEAAADAGVARIVGFGDHPAADARLLDCTLHPDRSEVSAAIDGHHVDYTVAVPGAHWVTNSLAVLTTVAAVGGDVDRAAAALAGLQAMKGRGARRAIRLGGGPFTLIDDSYNANPSSVRAALAVLGRDPARRKLAVLGDMLELGARSADDHAGLAQAAAEAGIDLVFTCGGEMRALHAALPESRRGGHADTAEALAPIVAEAVRPDDAVLVKGSLGARMARVVAALEALDLDAAAGANDGDGKEGGDAA